jgi:hypothetical protein
MSVAASLIATTMNASTPLLLAALGILVEFKFYQQTTKRFLELDKFFGMTDFFRFRRDCFPFSHLLN